MGVRPYRRDAYGGVLWYFFPPRVAAEASSTFPEKYARGGSDVEAG